MNPNIQLYDVPAISSVQELLLRSARVYGEKLALEDLKETPMPRLSFASLLKNVVRFGTALREIGLKERSHIAVISENRVQWCVTYLTGLCYDYVIAPIDRNLTDNEILNILHESDATAVVYSSAFEEMLSMAGPSLKKLKYFINMDLPVKREESYSMVQLIERSAGSSPEEMPQIHPDEMAEIIFTSGSLGRAKGVMLSQRNLASNLMAMTQVINIRPEDRFLMVLPIHHTYACTCGFLCPLYAGSSVHFARSLKTVVEDLQAVHGTVLLGVPLLFDKMFKRVTKAIKEKGVVTALAVGPLIKAGSLFERVGWKGFRRTVFKEIHERFGGTIRLFIAGGAAADPLVAKGLRDLGFTFLQGYGLTETSPILTLNAVQCFKDDSAGMVLPGVQLKIHEPDQRGVGEIWARGPNVMLGYYKNEELTKEVFEDGWFKTGDLGSIDHDGFLHISGRKKNVIISKSGENVYPEEVEDVLHRSPFILESMVYGERDKKLDEIIAAQIVVDAEAFIEYAETKQVEITRQLMEQVIADEITRLNKQLAGFKQVRKFYVRDKEFEKTTTQKVKRFLVHTMEHVHEQ